MVHLFYMNTIVAIDIETTGLDNDREAIIEIGAVKFKGNRVEAEWSSLINPNRHISEFITTLTGIDDAMVREAPRVRDVAHELEAFVGDAPIVGHNIRFDLGFLQKQIPFSFNDVIDTYELASILLPNANRYNLGALGKELGIALPATHRALDDARATHGVFNRLYEMARELPLDLIAEIVRLGEPIEWDGNYVFQEILRARAKEGIQAKKGKSNAPRLSKAKKQIFDDGSDRFPPLENPETPSALNPEEVASILEYGGPFSKYFESYEHRPEQVDVLECSY